MNRKKKKFEDMYEIIDQVIKKRKNKWKLKAITWFDFEDIEQIIKVHIHKSGIYGINREQLSLG